jgi:hypothetical protein
MSATRRAAPLLLLLAFASPAAAVTSKGFIFQSDYVTGSLSGQPIASGPTQCDVASVNNDASLRFYDGLLYVVNRYGGDNVQVIDPSTYATVRQFSVGNGSNPHDIAFASPSKAYVSRYDATDLWIVNPATGVHTGTISLAGFADADGNPEMDRLVVAGPYLFVSLEILNRNNNYLPADTARVAVIDTRADTLVDCDPTRPGVQAIALQLRNPFTSFQFDPATSRLLIGCVGNTGGTDGGIERIDPVNLVSTGVAITGAALGGDVDDVVWGDANKSWAIVADPSGNTKFVTWSATSGTVTSTLWNPGGYVLADAEKNDQGEVWVCDNSFSSPRVRRFSTTTDLAVGSDITCTLPSVAVTFDAETGQISGVTSPPPPHFAFAPPAPSPARASTRLAFSLERGARVRLEAFDAAGRRVRLLADAVWPAGPGALTWDLADDAGARVPPGLYLVRLRADRAEKTARVLVLH